MGNHSICWAVSNIIALVFDLMALNVQALLMKRYGPISVLSLCFGHFNPSLEGEMEETKWDTGMPFKPTWHRDFACKKNHFNFLKIKISSFLKQHDTVERERLGQHVQTELALSSITGDWYPFALSRVFLLATGN